jgi:lysine 6-dehydrogenase
MSKDSMTAPRVLVLGAGMIGFHVAKWLSVENRVIVADSNADRLQQLSGTTDKSLTTCVVDFTDYDRLTKLAEEQDVVVGAMPGRLAFNVLKELVSISGKIIVDMSFFEEDPFLLFEKAKKSGTMLVVDCGIAPGFSNFILGSEIFNMSVESFSCYVGGLPTCPLPPWNYKAPFSVESVLDEYTRPARIRVDGRIEEREPLSGLEEVPVRIRDRKVLLEAFYTDGLRTLLTQTTVPNMTEKTLRFPGHSRDIELLSETGLLNKDTINVRGTSVAPRDVTVACLKKLWELRTGDEEFTYMEIKLVGENNIGGRRMEVVHEIFDDGDSVNGVSSMARTTGHSCIGILNLILDGYVKVRGGVFAPEELPTLSRNPVGAYQYLVDYLLEKGITYCRSSEPALS